jgi:hypothetical protein
MGPQQWKEKEWQEYVNELLTTHHALHKEKYQRVPDLKGDHGLEGFTNTGVAYQAYADQNSSDQNDRVRKQKKKVYNDLNKLEEFAGWWTQFFDGLKLHRWHLVVPDFADKEVLKYARQRARVLKAKNLPFLADDFDAWVDTQKDYPNAMLMVRNPHLPKRGSDSVQHGDIAQFSSSNPAFVQKMDEKIAKVLPNRSPEDRLRYRETLLRWHLNASNYSDDLQSHFQPQWEQLEELIKTTGDSIETEGILDDSAASLRLKNTRKDFELALGEALPFIDKADRQAISWGTVARWLGECPLDFQG